MPGVTNTANINAVTPLLPYAGGSGVSNNVLSTYTVTGAFPLGVTLTASTNVTYPTSGTLLGADANGNVSANNFLSGYTTTVTSGGTTTLTVASHPIQYFTGSSNQTVVLPVVSTLPLGTTFTIVNNSSGSVSIETSSGSLFAVMLQSTILTARSVATVGTSPPVWSLTYSYLNSVASGSVGAGGQYDIAYYAVAGSAISNIPNQLGSVLITDPATGAPSLATALPSGFVVAIANGGTNVASVPTSATANSFAAWDANKNLPVNALLLGYATTATAAATTNLAVGSAPLQYFTGSTTQTVHMPAGSAVVLGQQYTIVNKSTGVVTVQSSGSNTIQAMAPNTQLILTCILASGTAASSWSTNYSGTSGETGRLLAVTAFTTSGTWTANAQTASVIVEVVGGGGGGAGSSASTLGGCGGGGGGYSKLYTSAQGASQTVTVGTGGAGGNNTPSSGVVGVTSSFGALATATGGAGGGFSTAAGVGNPGAGGVGASGTINVVGGPGGMTSFVAGSADAGGSGGNSVLGGGAVGIVGTAGQVGGNYGGGGSGCCQASASTGGAGAPGIVIVYEYS